MAENDNFRNGKVHVLSEKCSTCVFRPGNLMHLRPGALKEMVDYHTENQTAFACHQTLDIGEYVVEGNAICRGFFDAHGADIIPLRMAVAMDILVEQEPPTVKKREVAE